VTSVRTEDARERLLAAADELFYAEGVHTVGIDRVIEQAGVAKATLYSTFGSKDALIAAYLMRRHQRWQDGIAEHLAHCDTPRDRLLGVFDWLGETLAHPDFHGCAFMNASAEDRPGGPAKVPAEAHRGSIRSLFTQLAAEAKAIDPEHLGGQLALLYDGATVAARMDHNPHVASTSRQIAATLIDASTGHADDGSSRARAQTPPARRRRR
jgi:AcrR family transcriptional regulator